MAQGDLVYNHMSIGGGATAIQGVNQFEDVQGNSLSSSDALIVRNIVFSGNATIFREVDENGNGVFLESNDLESEIQNPSSEGERASDTLIYTERARIGIQDDTGGGIDAVIIGEQVDPSKVFLEVNQINNGSEVSHTVPVGEEHQVIELGLGGGADLDRRFDENDNGVFETDVNVDSFAAGTVTEQWLGGLTPSGRTNPLVETVLVNTSGSQNTYAILGTIGQQV